MENLNDLIWTDEIDNENGDISTQGTEMHKACMIAFCGGGSSDPIIEWGTMTQFACGRTGGSHSAPCH